MLAKSILKLFRKVNLWKTVYFNLHYFPWKTALRLPVFIYKRSELYKMKGRIVINAPVKTGMMKLGPHGLGTQDMLFERTMWEVAGTLVINGNACIGRGSKISIGENATLTLGDNFTITGSSDIICHKAITFGRDCLLSWDILMMDTDFHNVLDLQGKKINAPKPITIGNHVWIGCRNTVLKGTTIADNCIVSANSTITRSFDKPNCIVGGNGKNAGTIKEDIDWEQ